MPTRYAFKTTGGPVRPVGSFTFAPVAGGTEVTFQIHAELAGLKKLLMGSMVQSSMNAEAAALDKAKAVIEG